jgi:glyoxylase-like metal-dependent hydrolase (beta-lactamase superfamily II)
MTAHADEFQALSDNLYCWSVYEPSLKCDLGSTALKLGAGLVVIDPAPLAEAAWKELLAIAPLRAILLTNGNHVRAADALRRLHRVPVVTAPLTRRDITEIKPEVVLLENERLYGISAIPIPGATPGETAFHSDTGVMIVGDAVINTSTERGLELLPDKYCADAGQNRESLRKLLNYDFHTLTLAHGLPVTTLAKEKLRALLENQTTNPPRQSP